MAKNDKRFSKSFKQEAVAMTRKENAPLPITGRFACGRNVCRKCTLFLGIVLCVCALSSILSTDKIALLSLFEKIVDDEVCDEHDDSIPFGAVCVGLALDGGAIGWWLWSRSHLFLWWQEP